MEDNNGRNDTSLRLHKLILYNFKSFYGEQVIGPFHDEFNAIIGPNGSSFLGNE